MTEYKTLIWKGDNIVDTVHMTENTEDRIQNIICTGKGD